MRPVRRVSVRPCGLRGAAISPVRIRCSLISLLAVAMGCATASVSRTDLTGSVAWRVTALQRVPTTVHDRPGERYTFTLLLHEQAGAVMTFTRVTQTVSAAQVQPMTLVQDGEWRLPPKGELRLPFRLGWSCPAMAGACSAVAGPPHWQILLTGTDDRGDPVQLGLDVEAPAAAEPPSVYQSNPLERHQLPDAHGSGLPQP
jgi:hypothetical protein